MSHRMDPLIENIERAAKFCLVCSNPKRMLILCYLLKFEKLNVTELVEKIETLSQSALSQHLAVLRSENIVAVEKISQASYYYISDPSVLTVLGTLQETFCSRSE